MLDYVLVLDRRFIRMSLIAPMLVCRSCSLIGRYTASFDDPSDDHSRPTIRIGGHVLILAGIQAVHATEDPTSGLKLNKGHNLSTIGRQLSYGEESVSIFSLSY